jgi:N-carbamoyl-L-amino-acid hydrolase
MREDCGFDDVTIDAVGNVVGIYHGADPSAKRMLTGSHYDTVRNGGKYDGRLGILVPMACVRELHRQGKRLAYGIEVVGFAEEEGQRYKAVFLGSGALCGSFDMAWLDQKDADGITMRAAIEHAGLKVDDIAALKRDPAHYLGFVETHIEQGPVLNDLDLPLGVVTSINGSVRFVGEIVGVASHAGTTPMTMRRDAAAAAAELAAICARRGLQYTLEETMRAAAAPCAPEWRQRWERAVETLGLPVFRMPSGAGHDAMKIHDILPQAMLFLRGLNAGISHNPLESITNDDTELCVRAFQTLLDQLATEF